MFIEQRYKILKHSLQDQIKENSSEISMRRSVQKLKYHDLND